MEQEVTPQEGELNGDSKLQIERAKKNLVYVGILSIIMLFAGLTSAYIVSMGDSFWLKAPLPSAFWISTTLIVLSSIAIQLAIVMIRKGNTGGLKVGVVLTFILGLGFVYFQFKGYGQLMDNGLHFTGSGIVVSEGKYGDYYEVKMDGKFIEVNGNDYLLAGKKLTDAQMKDFQKFMSQFLKLEETKQFKVSEYGKRFQLYFHNELLSVNDEELFVNDTTQLEYLDRQRLTQLAINVKDSRGDFFVRGEMGKDFHVYYKGQELSYKDRQLQKDGRELDGFLQVRALESADTASSYLYIITFLHLLHIIITVLYLTRIVIHSFSGRISVDNNISLRVGAIFWHFLGLLWVFLLLFLLFIH